VSSAITTFDAPIPALTDGVVTLRMPRIEDADDLVEYYRDPEIRRWDDTVPPHFTSADAAAWVAAADSGRATGERYQFAVEAGGRLVGDLNLRPQGAGLALIGYGLKADHRGQGLMSRALRLALPWGFQAAGLDVVHWQAQVGNWASRRVAWAVGFRVDGVVPGLLAHDGGRVDGWLAALRRTDRLEPAHPWYRPERITGRIAVLRPHAERDLPRLIEACRDPETRQWLRGLPDDYAPTHARWHLDQVRADQAAGRQVCWAVADPEDDRLLAEIALFVRDPPDRYGEIGYWTHPDARGRGVTTEGVQLAVRHALLPAEDGGLGLPRVLLRADADNRASLRVAEKAGFLPSGRDRDATLRRDGSRGDHLRFDLLAHELPAVR
jgi:RimJ/RimL family protein N-acetyltransferase